MRAIMFLQRRISDETKRLGALGTLNSNAAALGASISRLTESVFDARSISSSDGSVLAASVTAGAIPTTYDIEVSQLAQAHKVGANGFADSDETSIAAAAGTFSFRVGDGDVVDIDVDVNTTLEDLATRINNDSSSGIVATIINDGSDTNAYRLVLSSKTYGVDGAISITNNDTALTFATGSIGAAAADPANTGAYAGAVASSGTYTGLTDKTYLVEFLTGGQPDAATYKVSTDGGSTWDDNGGSGYTATTAASAIGGNTEGVELSFAADPGNDIAVGDRWTVAVTASDSAQLHDPEDALLTVDGISVVGDSNVLSDVIPDVTLTLLGETSGSPIVVTVAADTSVLTSELNGVFTNVNIISGFVATQSAYDQEKGIAQPLQGDATLRGLYRNVRSVLGGFATGLEGESYSALSSLGIKSNSVGTYSFNTGTLLTALNENPDNVQRVLLDYGVSDTTQIQYTSQTGDTQVGTYNIEVFDDGGSPGVRIGGLQAAVSGTTVTGPAGSAVEGLILEIPNLETLAFGDLGSVQISKGILSSLQRTLSEWTDSDTGAIPNKRASVQANIAQANEQIARHEQRMVQVEERMRRQFTNLEITMGQLQMQSDFITQQMAILSGNTGR